MPRVKDRTISQRLTWMNMLVCRRRLAAGMLRIHWIRSRHLPDRQSQQSIDAGTDSRVEHHECARVRRS